MVGDISMLLKCHPPHVSQQKIVAPNTIYEISNSSNLKYFFHNVKCFFPRADRRVSHVWENSSPPMPGFGIVWKVRWAWRVAHIGSTPLKLHEDMAVKLWFQEIHFWIVWSLWVLPHAFWKYSQGFFHTLCKRTSTSAKTDSFSHVVLRLV